MSTVTQAVRDHHAELFGHLSEQVEALVAGRPEGDAAALAEFLVRDLLPHAAGEETHMYPAVEPLIKAHGRATATMSVDHEFITGYVREIEAAGRALREAGAAERPALLARAQRAALQLEAVLRVHLAKEERVYLPLFEQFVAEGDQQRVLDGMHAAYESA